MRAFPSFNLDLSRFSVAAPSAHTTRVVRVCGSALVIFGSLAVSLNASAFCTLHSCQDVSPAQAEADKSLVPKTCEREDSCIVEGHELFWGAQCLSFGVSALNTSVLGLTPDEFHDIVADAYRVWEEVDCPGGGHPGFQVGSVGIVEESGNFFCESEPQANVSIWSLVTRWKRDPAALGYTSSTHNKRDGEIFDADVELNLNKIEHEHRGNYVTVLKRIAVHEAGHYLGLAHSNVGNAVMDESYNAVDLLTKELSQDDIDGICKLYPPEKLECSMPGYVEAGLNQEACDDAAAEASKPDDVAGCSVRGAGRSDHSSRSLLSSVAATALALALARKRRR